MALFINFDSKLDENDDLNNILNLNCANIKEERRKILVAIKKYLVRYKFDKKFIRKTREYWKKKNGDYKAFCQVAIFELEKYI